jgi:hypothetical protein
MEQMVVALIHFLSLIQGALDYFVNPSLQFSITCPNNRYLNPGNKSRIDETVNDDFRRSGRVKSRFGNDRRRSDFQIFLDKSFTNFVQ